MNFAIFANIPYWGLERKRYLEQGSVWLNQIIEGQYALDLLLQKKSP